MANKKIYPNLTITDRLNEAFDKCHMTDVWWSYQLDVERKCILHFRQGISQPRASQIKLICEIAKVDANWLLGLDGEDDA